MECTTHDLATSFCNGLYCPRHKKLINNWHDLATPLCNGKYYSLLEQLITDMTLNMTFPHHSVMECTALYSSS